MMAFMYFLCVKEFNSLMCSFLLKNLNFDWGGKFKLLTLMFLLDELGNRQFEYYLCSCWLQVI